MCSTYNIQIIFAAQDIHIGASLMFVEPKIQLKEVEFHFFRFSIQKMTRINMYLHMLEVIFFQ